MISTLACLLMLIPGPSKLDLTEVGSCLPNRPLLYRADKAGYGYADDRSAWFFDEHGRKQEESFPVTSPAAAMSLDSLGNFLEAGGTPKSGWAMMVRGKTFRRVGHRLVLDGDGGVYASPSLGGGIGISSDSKTIVYLGTAPVLPLLWVNEVTASGEYVRVREVVPLAIDVGMPTLMSRFRDLTFISPTTVLFIGQIAAPADVEIVAKWVDTLPDLTHLTLSSSSKPGGSHNYCMLMAMDIERGYTKGVARLSFVAPTQHDSGDFGAGTLISSSDNKWVFLKVADKVFRLSSAAILKNLGVVERK